jgi:hypothetical protein
VIDARSHVPRWLRPDVKLFNLLVHILSETNRHAGHADILREQLGGKVGSAAAYPDPREHDTAYWAQRCAQIERAAQATSR